VLALYICDAPPLMLEFKVINLYRNVNVDSSLYVKPDMCSACAHTHMHTHTHTHTHTSTDAYTYSYKRSVLSA